ncbi:MAG: hypothetical protein ABI068_04370 [Ktedonobacterales bacterium]
MRQRHGLMDGRENSYQGRNWGRSTRLATFLVVGLTLLTMLALTGCSSSGSSSKGGINYSLGLAGSTVDHPSQPPTIAANGPDATYAFVYDNQLWLRSQGSNTPKELTRLVLSNGSDIAWGPLIWSPDGRYIAFALVENLTPTDPQRTSGPIYIVDTQDSGCAGGSCAVSATAGDGSIYGHSYAWYDSNGNYMLIYGNGGGLMFYDLSDPNGGPRVWQARTSYTDQYHNSNESYTCGSQRSYGDLSVSGNTLYYSCLNLSGLGNSGTVGDAYVNSMSLDAVANALSLGAYDRNVALAQLFNGGGPGANQVIHLGKAYADAQGNYTAGAWSIRGGSIAYQFIRSVDTKAAAVSFSTCKSSLYSGSCDGYILSNLTSQPLAVHPQLAIAGNGQVALTGDALYVDDSAQDKLAPVNWPGPFAWTADGGIVVTQLLKSSVDASGVTRNTTTLTLYHPGQQPITLIQDAQDIAFH